VRSWPITLLVLGCCAGLVLVFARDGRGQGFRRSEAASVSSRALPRSATAPPGNPASPRKIELGRVLFWDPILSGHKDVACATCHHPRFGYAENRDISIGVHGTGLGDQRQFAAHAVVTFVKRNSQTILNTAFNGIDDTGTYAAARAPMFWDLRVQSLEEQALVPLKTFEEMRGDAYGEDVAVAQVVARLNANEEYQRLFAGVFGGPGVTAEQIAQALAAFQRSLTAANAPFDRYMRGERTAMTDAQVRGMQRFERVGCANCHSGPMFSDFKLHVLGVPDNPRLPGSDTGVDETYAFRTASLRNLPLTAPYMHSGVFDSLRDVLEFYDDVTGRRGERRNPNVSREQLDPLLRQLRDPDRQTGDIISFLEALSDESFDRTIPKRVPSGLPPGGAIQ